MPGKEGTLYTESGRSGLTRFGGIISEEWVRDLQGVKGTKVYREMRDNDAIVGAFLYAVEMLLRQVKWRIDKGGDTPADEEAQIFLESCKDDMAMSWQDTLSEILSMLPFGWAYLETVYKKRSGQGSSKTNADSKYTDGRIGWKKWGLRAQETLVEWVYDDEDNLLGMKQQASPNYQTLFVPYEKSLLFRLNVTKNNPQGRSLLRNAYRSWFMKKNIEEVEAIGIERDLAGFPIVWLPEEIISGTATAEGKIAYEAWKKIITNIRRDEQEGVMMPLVYDSAGNKKYDLTLLTSTSRRQFDTNTIVQRYDQRIAVTVMADFLLLGSSDVGSFALSSNKTSLFATALGTILESITGIINTIAIPRLFALNDFGKLTELPTLVHEDIETPDLAILGDFIQKLAGAQMPLFPDIDLENYLRSSANLPLKVEDEADEPEITTGTNKEKAIVKIEKQYNDDRDAFMDAVKDLQKAVREGMEKDNAASNS